MSIKHTMRSPEIPAPLVDAATKLRTAARLIGEVMNEMGVYANLVEPTTDAERVAVLEWSFALEKLADLIEAPWGTLPGDHA